MEIQQAQLATATQLSKAKLNANTEAIFEALLADQTLEAPVPTELQVAKKSLESGTAKTQYELKRLSSAFYNYGHSFIDNIGESKTALEKITFSVSALDNIVENYGSKDALKDLLELWKSVDQTSPLYQPLLKIFNKVLSGDKLSLKGIDKSSNFDSNKDYEKVTAALKKQLFMQIINMSGSVQKDYLMTAMSGNLAEEDLAETDTTTSLEETDTSQSWQAADEEARQKALNNSYLSDSSSTSSYASDWPSEEY